jgi:L-rhamnose-H+ transport protein
MQGSFVLPMKYTRKWEWENTWLVFCFLGFIVLPSALVLLTVPQPGRVLSSSPFRSVLLAAVFGLGWGCGSVLFGLGIKALGIGLGYSIILGLTGSLGSIIPWFTASTKASDYSLLLWCGVFIMLVGVVVCSIAGRERESGPSLERLSEMRLRGFFIGLAICVASGILSCFMNLGFTYGAEVTRRAEALGSSAAGAPNLLWLIIMSSGFVANALYCGHLLVKEQSWRKFRIHETLTYLGQALLMALLWVGSLVTYGMGANKIGHLGPSVGWPILMCLCIVTSNFWGVATGEWQGASRRTAVTMAFGIGILLLAVVVLGWASTKA